MVTEAMLKVDEVAAQLRLNPETVRRWLLGGKLRGVRPGGTKAGWRIPASEVERVLRSGGAGDVGYHDHLPTADIEVRCG